MIVIAAAIEEGEHFAAYFKKIGLILFGLNVSAMVLSYYFAKMMKCRPNQWMIIAIETGVQNSALAIVMGVSIMNSIFVAIPPTIYTLIMFSSVSFVLFFHNQKEKV